MNIDPPDWIMELIFPTLIDPPGVFMLLNLVWLGAFCYILVRFMRWLVDSTEVSK